GGAAGPIRVRRPVLFCGTIARVKIHHVSCGTMCPAAGRLVGAPLICHCLILETEADGIIAVDTGFGAADVALPERLPRGFAALSRPTLEPRETLVSHLRRLGLDPRELRHIVVTHLDLDHAGAIADFPEATVHVHAREHAAAHARATFRER